MFLDLFFILFFSFQFVSAGMQNPVDWRHFVMSDLSQLDVDTV